MEIKKSQFVMERFLIVSSNIESVPLKPGEKTLPELNIDIDFDFYETNKPEEKYIIKLEIKANEDKEIPGYSFHIIAQGVFKFQKKRMAKKSKRGYVVNSGLPLMINSIRLYLANISSFGPFGTYLIPLIDIKDLIEKKKKLDKSG